jgi:hypothetical protein
MGQGFTLNPKLSLEPDLVVRLLLVLSSSCEVHPKLFQIFLKL